MDFFKSFIMVVKDVLKGYQLNVYVNCFVLIKKRIVCIIAIKINNWGLVYRPLEVFECEQSIWSWGVGIFVESTMLKK